MHRVASQLGRERVDLGEQRCYLARCAAPLNELITKRQLETITAAELAELIEVTTLCAERTAPYHALCDLFDQRTQDGQI